MPGGCGGTELAEADRAGAVELTEIAAITSPIGLETQGPRVRIA